jgi:hypothetical protein
MRYHICYNVGTTQKPRKQHCADPLPPHTLVHLPPVYFSSHKRWQWRHNLWTRWHRPRQAGECRNKRSGNISSPSIQNTYRTSFCGQCIAAGVKWDTGSARFTLGLRTRKVAYMGEVFLDRNYKVVQIWPGQTVTCLHTNGPGHIWTTLYIKATYDKKYRCSCLALSTHYARWYGAQKYTVFWDLTPCRLEYLPACTSTVLPVHLQGQTFPALFFYRLLLRRLLGFADEGITNPRNVGHYVPTDTA